MVSVERYVLLLNNFFFLWVFEDGVFKKREGGEGKEASGEHAEKRDSVAECGGDTPNVW